MHCYDMHIQRFVCLKLGGGLLITNIMIDTIRLLSVNKIFISPFSFRNVCVVIRPHNV
jgi:hypothetical protein